MASVTHVTETITVSTATVTVPLATVPSATVPSATVTSATVPSVSPSVKASPIASTVPSVSASVPASMLASTVSSVPTSISASTAAETVPSVTASIPVSSTATISSVSVSTSVLISASTVIVPSISASTASVTESPSLPSASTASVTESPSLPPASVSTASVTESPALPSSKNSSKNAIEYKVYKTRWLVLATIAFLNISNAAIWLSYAPVATFVADFYGTSITSINYFSLVYLAMTLPLIFVVTYCTNRYGLKAVIISGATLNFVGAAIKALGTSPLLDQSAMFAVSLTGQTIAAMAQSCLIFLPTKVSQNWFPEHQRTLATTILAMANPLGIVVAQTVSPVIILSSSDVPMNNYIWLGLAVVMQLVTLLCIRTSVPPSPPSQSAECSAQPDVHSYVTRLKKILSSRPYVILMLTLGYGMALFYTLSTVTQQVLCSVGYSSVFSGVVVITMIMFGFLGSALCGAIAARTGSFTSVLKSFFLVAAFIGITLYELYLLPNQEIAIIVVSAVFGFFGLGVFPVGLELGVETTYPVEESMSTAFIYLSGQLQASFLILFVGLLSVEQSEEDQALQVCSTIEGGIGAKDYSYSMMAMMTIMSVSICVLVVGFHTPYKRRDAERNRQQGEAAAHPLS